MKTEIKIMNEELRKLPAVDKILQSRELQDSIEEFGRDLCKYAIQTILSEERNYIQKGNTSFSSHQRFSKIKSIIEKITRSSLKPVVNATGIILHTNLGRAPLGEKVLKELQPIIENYSNVEFDLERGRRGQRNIHISNLLQAITKAEDALVVNNNAAAVMLVLKTFGEDAEVIISRGELIEIGGSFRIPDIMRASGAKMVEVGTTNRTNLEDYQRAITSNTKIILKAHKSNYFIGGFTEETELKELAELAHKNDLLFFFDMGSGLLRKPANLPLKDEPDVFSALENGVDLVSFSGDKLLGGPQAGIICGKKRYIEKLAKAPMMRALRVGKLTISALIAVMRSYLHDCVSQEIPLFQLLAREENELDDLSQKMAAAFKKYEIDFSVKNDKAKVGGGSLPKLELTTKVIRLEKLPAELSAKEIFFQLLKLEKPILTILREGAIHLDLKTIFEKDIEYIAEKVAKILY